MPLSPFRLDVDAPESRTGLARVREELEAPGRPGTDTADPTTRTRRLSPG